MSETRRIVPALPPGDTKVRLIIDSDAATELDDLYAIALALYSPDRFSIEGFVATHFANKPVGRESIQRSHDLMVEILGVAGKAGTVPVVKGGDPISYLTEASESDGARLIIERAHAGSEEDPLWVVGIGAATNLASAVLLDPSICPKVRFVFHCRSEETWPEFNQQYNVAGDVRAARVLLQSAVPLVWFDTGQQLTVDMKTTEEKLKPLGGLPAFMHDYRFREKRFQADNKAVYDLADIAWMIDPAVCTAEEVKVPRMDWLMRFHHDGRQGRMLRVHSCKPAPVWELFYKRMGATA